MKYKKVLKFLKIIGSLYIIVPLTEITCVILLNFAPFIFDKWNTMLLSEFVYGSTIFPFSGTLLWLFVIISMFCFLILGIFIFRLPLKNNIESKPLAKLLVVIGMVNLLAGFVKMDFLVLLGKTNITTTYTTISFQSALYDPTITAIIPAIFWIYFISVNTFFLISGLMVTAVGIKFTLFQEEAEKNN